MRKLTLVLLASTWIVAPALADQYGPGPGGGSGAYTLPTATPSVLGGVKPDGTTITNTAGAVSVTYGSAAATAAQGNDGRITGALPATTAATTYAPLASPTFTGTVTIPTGASITGFAPLASPTFTGAPVVPGYVPTANIPSTPTTTPVCGSGAGGSTTACTGTAVLPNGTTASTQPGTDNTNKVATTANLTMSPLMFGTGIDGAVTISSGTTTLSKDAHYTNLTINGTGQINTNGYRILVSGILDISAAPAAAIISTGFAGVNASGATGGTTAGITGFGANLPHSAGNSGVGATGITGVGATPATVGIAGYWGFAASGSAGGTGGAGTNAAGAGGGVPAFSGALTFNTPSMLFPGGASAIMAPSFPGGGGGGGGGDGTNTGGGGGSGGNCPTAIGIWAHNIQRGTNVTAAIIQDKGAIGGNGGNSSAGNTGGGGGGGGGSGGFVYIVTQALLGSTIASAIDVSGATGGAGGNGAGTGVGGTGGVGGKSGNVQILNFNTPSFTNSTFNISGTNGSGPTGVTGGAGGAPATLQVGL